MRLEELDAICALHEDSPKRAELRREALRHAKPLTWALDQILALEEAVMLLAGKVPDPESEPEE